MEGWSKILLGDVERLIRPKFTRKLLFILKLFEVDLCGLSEEEQESTKVKE